MGQSGAAPADEYIGIVCASRDKAVVEILYPFPGGCADSSWNYCILHSIRVSFLLLVDSVSHSSV